MGKTVENAAKNAVERNAERATERAVDKAFDKTGEAVEGAVSGNGNNNATHPQQATPVAPAAATAEMAAAASEPVSLEMTYAKSDFVPGDEIFFEDNLANEQMGEFPSQWDLLNGNAEVASMAGVQAINLEKGSTATIAPLMKEKNYLPDVFTL
ncbi:MAG: OmpA family protein, partial [Alistipes sp.]|nr:OmpA family protein [Alistipes sp.]